jgi:hypothetical protein
MKALNISIESLLCLLKLIWSSIEFPKIFVINEFFNFSKLQINFLK